MHTQRTHTHMHTHACTHTYTHAHTHTHAHNTYAHAHTQQNTHARTYTHARTSRMHTQHTRTHTPIFFRIRGTDLSVQINNILIELIDGNILLLCKVYIRFGVCVLTVCLGEINSHIPIELIDVDSLFLCQTNLQVMVYNINVEGIQTRVYVNDIYVLHSSMVESAIGLWFYY